MKNLKYNLAKKRITITVIYVFAVKRSPTKTIELLYYSFRNDNNKWVRTQSITPNELGKQLFDDKIIAWAGTLDNKNSQFNNICKIVPVFDGEKFYVSSVSDNNIENNLEFLPERTSKK